MDMEWRAEAIGSEPKQAGLIHVGGPLALFYWQGFSGGGVADETGTEQGGWYL